jgi:hypothetical protein
MGLLFLIGIRMVLAGFYMVCVNRCVNHEYNSKRDLLQV